MSSQARQSDSFGNEMTNILIVALIGTFGLTLVLRAAGSAAAVLTGASQPGEGISGGVGVLFDPTDPGRALGSDALSPFVYWLVAGMMLAILVVVLMWAWTRWRRHSCKVDTDSRRLQPPHTRFSPPRRPARYCFERVCYGHHLSGQGLLTMDSISGSPVGRVFGRASKTQFFLSAHLVQARTCTLWFRRSSTHRARS